MKAAARLWITGAERTFARPQPPPARALLAVLFAVVNMFPIYWMMSGALSPIDAHLSGDVLDLLVPRQVTVEHFQAILGKPQFAGYVVNSLVVAAATTTI